VPSSPPAASAFPSCLYVQRVIWRQLPEVSFEVLTDARIHRRIVEEYALEAPDPVRAPPTAFPIFQGVLSSLLKCDVRDSDPLVVKRVLAAPRSSFTTQTVTFFRASSTDIVGNSPIFRRTSGGGRSIH
jgi:hypothetical protein